MLVKTKAQRIETVGRSGEPVKHVKLSIDLWVNTDNIATMRPWTMEGQPGSKLTLAVGGSCIEEYVFDPPEHFLKNPT